MGATDSKAFYLIMRGKWIQRALLSVALLVLAAVIAVFIGYRHFTDTPDALLDLAKEKADMKLKRVQQTAMKNGIQEWTLDAVSATLLEAEKSVLLAKPEVTFFMENGDHIYLTADSGVIRTDSSHLQVKGRVTAITEQYRFETEKLEYDPNHRELLSDVPVSLSGKRFSLEANRMIVDLNENVTRFENGVKGTIKDDFQL